MSLSLLLLGALSLPSHAPAPTQARTPVESPASPRLGLDEARPVIGIQLAPVGPAVAAHLPDHLGGAVILTDVLPDSPAAQAGLQVHDVVYGVDGDTDVTVKGLVEQIGSKDVGDLLLLDVSRKGSQFRLSVILTDFRPSQSWLRRNAIDHAADRAFGKSRGNGWPRFGLAPDNKIMIQKKADGSWFETDARFPDGSQQWLDVLRRQGDFPLHLDDTKLDPDGSLREELLALKGIYADARGNELWPDATSGGLEGRVTALESKLDEMHALLKRLAADAK